MKLADFKNKGYKGFDVSLAISLFEYGFIYSREDEKSEGVLRVWYKVQGNLYDWADFRQDLDFWKEFNWIKKEDLLSFFGGDESEFNELELEYKLNTAIMYYGEENICGTSYYPTKIVEED